MTDETTKVPVQTAEKPAAPAAFQGVGALDNLKQDIDRLFDNFSRGVLSFPSARALFRMIPDLGTPDLPAIDAVETETSYKLTAELPGLDAKDIDVKLSNGSLTIRGEKRSQKEETKGQYYMSERRYGSFERSFPLPPGVNRDAIEASFDKGVLTLTLPKTADAQKPAKTIEVKAA